MKRASSLCMLLLSLLLLSPAFLSAQAVDQELPNEPLVLALWRADVQITLEDDATPRLKARAVKVGATDEEVEGPTVRITKEGATWKIVRAAESKDVRLQVELIAHRAQQIKLTGSELGVSVQGPPIDFEEMASMRDLAQSGGGEIPAPVWSDVTLALADSQADVFGVSGAMIQGRNTYFIVRQSSNQLNVELEGGGAEIEQHRGELNLTGFGDYALRDIVGKTGLDLSGGSLELNVGEGVIDGQAAESALRFFEWAGLITLETRGGELGLRNFQAGRQEITLDVQGTVTHLEGIPQCNLDIKQAGGILRIRDVEGKNRVETRLKAEVELERLPGSWNLLFQESEVRGEELERLIVESYNSSLELEEVAGLELTAHGSSIEISDLERLSKGSLVGSTAQIGIIDGGRGEIDAQAQSRATLNLSRPCFVLTGRPGVVQESTEGLEVFGCTQGPNNGGRGEDEEPSFLTVTFGGESTIDVRGF